MEYLEYEGDFEMLKIIEKKIKLLQSYVFNGNKERGWHTNLKTGKFYKRNKLELMALIHSEVSEAVEGIRKNLMDDKLPHYPMETVELADCVIRILDYCGLYELDLAGAIIEKLEYNANRADHKLSERQKENGKKY